MLELPPADMAKYVEGRQVPLLFYPEACLIKLTKDVPNASIITH